MSLFWRRDLEWGDVFKGSKGWSGVRGGGRDVSALRLVPVYAAVALIADLFSVLPQSCYQGTAGTRKKVELPSWLAKPDARLNGDLDWRYQYTTSLKLRGNAYGLVTGPAHRPLGVRWLHPDTVRVDESDPTGPRYFIGGSSDYHTLLSQGGDIVHVREFVQPGSVVGLSPIAHFAQQIALGNYAAAFGHDYFAKSAVPTSLLMSKKALKAGQAAEAKRLFREAVADGGPVTLDQDWDYKTLTVSPAEAQFLETIRANATTIAVIFRVPPEDVGGDTGSSRTYGNREADAERFNVRTMLPHVTRYELAMGEVLPAGTFVKLNMDALSRPNLLERSRANTENLRNGTLTLAEARLLEDRPALTPQQIEQWQLWYSTTKSVSESIAESLSITQEGG